MKNICATCDSLIKNEEIEWSMERKKGHYQQSNNILL